MTMIQLTTKSEYYWYRGCIKKSLELIWEKSGKRVAKKISGKNLINRE